MLDFSHVLNNPNADVQSFFAPSIPTIATNLASVTLATGGVLTVPSGSYYVGQVIQITGTFSAGSITGYVSGNYYYVITVTSATSITISATPGGTAVTSTAGTATPGATFNISNSAGAYTATIVTSGTNYQVNDTIIFTGGTGNGAYANVKTVNATGSITSVE